MNKYYLALDQGTTSSRAILYDLEFNIIAKFQIDITQIYPQEGWVEHNPIEIWESQLNCCNEVIKKANIKSNQIEAIGITNQRETIVAWDKLSGNPISNALVWQDRRTSSDCVIDLEKIGLEKNRMKTGLNIDAYFSAPKIRWILKNNATAIQLLKSDQLCIGTIDTWLVWNLTKGEYFITDVSNASRTNLFNIQNLEWDTELLSYYQIPKDILPNVVDSIGIATMTATDIFGLSIPIAGIAGDQQSALFGHKCFRKGMMKNTFGTGCFLLQNIGNNFKLSENKLLTTIAWKKGEELVYALEGSVFNAGSALKWLKENLRLFDEYSEADELASSIPSTENVYVVPAFTGLGAPYWDMQARATIIGLNRNTNRAHIIRATFESLAYQCKDIVDTLAKDSGVPIESLQIDGGVSKSPFLQQFLADILQKEIVISPSEECTALGVAMMAAEGLGRNIDEIDIKHSNTKTPQLKLECASKLYEKWLDAVTRSKNWA
jgi:glycerol kinase